MVIAHVYAHVDFFKNNKYFSHTNRKAIDEMANHATRVRQHMDRRGVDEVEEFIDHCLSLENLIDPFRPHIEREPDTEDIPDETELEEHVEKLPSKEYMQDYINPEGWVEQQKAQLQQEWEQLQNKPPEPLRDVLIFLLRHADLERWEADILSIIREEAYYFAPQMQTKIMNEGWACLTSDERAVTEDGLLPMDEVVNRTGKKVYDGEKQRAIVDSHIIEDEKVVEIETHRGYTLEGSETHRVMLEDGSGKSLAEASGGDETLIDGGADIWDSSYVEVDWQLDEYRTLEDVADQADVSVSTVIRHRQDEVESSSAEKIDQALQDYDPTEVGVSMRKKVCIPGHVSPRFGEFLGLLIGDGHISRVQREIGFTSGELSNAQRFRDLAKGLFGVECHLSQDGSRWRVGFHAETVSDFLENQGLTSGPSAQEKTVPECIFRSPKEVVRRFLVGLFDADGYAGESGVILSTSSQKMSKQVQSLLLNFGVLTTRTQQNDGCYQVAARGQSAKKYRDQVNFGLSRKRLALEEYVEDRQWFQKEYWMDTVSSVSEGVEDVYDITVEHSHRYSASGFINHNSYWHTEIMKEVLSPDEIVEFADLNSGILKSKPKGMNPYRLGIQLFRDIEERWDKGKFGREWENVETMEERENWDKELGEGRDKIFNVRKVHNDVTFIDEFLTPEFVAENNLYTYGYEERRGRSGYFIKSREFQSIKEQLLDSRTNNGEPLITVIDGNFKNAGELLLHHKYEGEELRHDYTKRVLPALYRIWKRPVNLETVKDGEGTLMTYDGSYTESSIDYEPLAAKSP